MSDEVSTWTSVKTFHPEMTLQVAAPAEAVLAALAEGLAGSKFKIRKSDATGLEARYVNWFDMVAGTINKTTVAVSTSPDEHGVSVLVEGHSTGEHLSGPKRAAEGLSAGVASLRGAGHDVTVHPWVVPDDRKKGKRR